MCRRTGLLLTTHMDVKRSSPKQKKLNELYETNTNNEWPHFFVATATNHSLKLNTLNPFQLADAFDSADSGRL